MHTHALKTGGSSAVQVHTGRFRALTLPQEVARASVPVDRQLGQAGAELHMADACIGVPVPLCFALFVEAIEAEA